MFQELKKRFNNAGIGRTCDSHFSNGHVIVAKFWESTVKYLDENPEVKLIDVTVRKYRNPGIIRNSASKEPKYKKDGFKAGWNTGLGEYVKDKGHYNKLLKEKGLVEVGNEQIKPKITKERPIVTEASIKDAVSNGAKISDNEGRALESGTYE